MHGCDEDDVNPATMTAQSPPSAEPEAVRLARRMLTEQWHGQDTVELAEHILRDHEQRERAREGMDEALKLARNVVENCTGAVFAKALKEPESCSCNRCVLSRALLAAHERIAALQAEKAWLDKLSDDLQREVDTLEEDALQRGHERQMLLCKLGVSGKCESATDRSRLAGLLWRVKRERDEARKVAACCSDKIAAEAEPT